MVHRPRAHMAARVGRPDHGSHTTRKRRRCITCGNHYLRGTPSGYACLGGSGLGCCAFDGRDVHAGAPPHQFWNHAAVSISCSRETINNKTKRRHDGNAKACAIDSVGFHTCARIARADQARRNARGRHDLKFLSLRGETTPRTPVWRSKRGSQLDRWKGSGDSEGRRANRSFSAAKGDV